MIWTETMNDDGGASAPTSRDPVFPPTEAGSGARLAALQREVRQSVMKGYGDPAYGPQMLRDERRTERRRDRTGFAVLNTEVA